MTQTTNKAIIHYSGEDLWVGISPSGHAQVLDTNHELASAPTPMELLLISNSRWKCSP